MHQGHAGDMEANHTPKLLVLIFLYRLSFIQNLLEMEEEQDSNYHCAKKSDLNLFQ